MQIYLPIAEMPVSILLIMAMSAAVGFVSGLFGVGGGFLMTPLLIFSGVPIPTAVATTSAQIAASSTTGVLTYWRRRQVDVDLAKVLISGGIVGTALGVALFDAIRRAGALDTAINLSYLALFTIIGGMMLAEALRAAFKARRGVPPRRRRAGQHAAWLGWPLRHRFRRSRLYASILPLMLVAALIGLLGAVLGIGGGFIMVPALIYLFRIPTTIAVGTSLVQILVTALLATVLHAVSSQSVDLVLAVLLMIGGVFGAQFGARAARNIKADAFRLFLALLLLAVGARFAMLTLIKPDEPYSITIQGGR
jgi:uncharacterized protein